MQIGLKQLIEPGLEPLVHESKHFYEARQAKKQPDVTTLAGLQEARDARKTSLAILDREVVESIAKADGMEDTFVMAARLSAANCEVDLRVYPEAVHGFTSHPTKIGEAATQDIFDWLKQRLIV